jgi:glycosyltransferase involved in cell wall biosynthesis
MKILHAGCTANGEPLNGFQKAMIKVSTDYREINNSSSHKDVELIRVNRELQPDIIFFQYQSGGVINPATYSQLKRDNPNAWVVNFTGDVRHPLPAHYVETGSLIDCTLFCNYTDVYEARRQGINAEYLQYGIDPEIYYPDQPSVKAPEIIFCGNNYVNQFELSIKRSQMVDFLKKEYGSRFGVYGTNWQYNDGNYMGDQKGEAHIYRACKIGINLSHFDYERYSSDRMFRLMGCGALCMTHRYAGLHLDFEPGVNVVAWDTFEHLKHQIDYYLEHEDERKQIAQAGADKIHTTHTFDAMIANLIEIYKKKKNGKV